MKKLAHCALATSLLSDISTGYTLAEDASSIFDAISKADVGLTARYRLELVDQDGFDKDATASTLRTTVWYKSAPYKGFSGYLEFENVSVLGKTTYNDSVNGNTTRPVVADPAVTAVNQAYLNYKTGKVSATFGRQGINLGNQRFVGTVGWRQNDQTFDNANVAFTPTENLSVLYAYVWNVNRIFGDDHPLGDLDTDSHIVNIDYKGLPFGKLSAYGYFLDLNDAAVYGLSSSTIGARLDGKQKLGESTTVGYELEYAKQTDYKDNPADFSADYFHGAANIAFSGVKLGAGYELLGSDNGVSFKTPLATLHKFNGWADKFLTTPASGLEDIYVSAAYKVPGDGALGGISMLAVYHDFSSDVGDVDYGSEFDIQFARPIVKGVTGLVKAAFYNADSFSTDTTKIWFMISAKL